MSDAAIYHRNKNECYRLAGHETDEDIRGQWLAMGLRWLQRAQAAEEAKRLAQPAIESTELTIRKRRKRDWFMPLAPRDAADSR